MTGARLCGTIYGKVLFALLVTLAFVRLAPHLISDYGFIITLRSLCNSAFNSQAHVAKPCTDWEVEAGSHRTPEQRLVIGSALQSLSCLDLAASILPEVTTTGDRSELLAYQWGLVAWAQGDMSRSVAVWRQVRGIDQRLLAYARQLRGFDRDSSQRWYEAAIMSADSMPVLTNAIATYTAEMRQLIGLPAFAERLTQLEAFFGADTAAGYRLRGQRSLMDGNYRVALEQLTQAIALGMDDAETWYLLGDAAWGLNDLTSAERAYREALDAPIQIAWRRAWHLDRLAALLAKTGRPGEALPFQEEAVRLDDYYYYADSLAVLYAQLGEENRAQALCRRARQLAGSAQQTPLRCERP